jgi:hypothetical protein
MPNGRFRNFGLGSFEPNRCTAAHYIPRSPSINTTYPHRVHARRSFISHIRRQQRYDSGKASIVVGHWVQLVQFACLWCNLSLLGSDRD